MTQHDATPPPDPAELERSYQQILNQQAWQLDVGLGDGADLGDLGDGGDLGLLDERPTPRTPSAESPKESETTSRGSRRGRRPAPPPLARIVEAMLFVGGEPLTAERAAAAVRGLNAEAFIQVIDELNRAYREQGRPYSIEPQDQGYALTLRGGYQFVEERFQAGVRAARLSGPAVDVLAVVAYRQPVTRREVEALRGHESGLLLRQLLRRALIAVVSRGESGGREIQYGTSPRFLELFGLASLDELPQTEDLQRL